MANPSTSAEAAAGCRGTKQTCLCSPTNHPGSFRCSRHRLHRAWPLPSSLWSSGRASQPATAAGMKSGAGVAGSRTASKGRSITLRAHLQRLVSPAPSSSGGSEHRRSREFKPRMSRLGRLAVNA